MKQSTLDTLSPILAELLEQIERSLAALEVHARGRQKRRPGRRSAKDGTADGW